MTIKEANDLLDTNPDFAHLLTLVQDYGSLLTTQMLGAALLRHANQQEGTLLQQLAYTDAGHVFTAADAIESDAN